MGDQAALFRRCERRPIQLFEVSIMNMLACALSLALQLPPGTVVTDSQAALTQGKFIQGQVAAVATDSRTYTSRALEFPGTTDLLSSPLVRTEAWDDQLNVLWTRDSYDAKALGAPNSPPLARDLIHDGQNGLIIHGRTLAESMVVEALDEATGQTVWETPIQLSPVEDSNSIRRLAWDAGSQRVLAFAVDGDGLWLHALESNSGQIAWSTELGPALGNTQQDPEFAIAPSTRELFVASKLNATFVSVRVQRVDLATGTATLLNDQYKANYYDIDATQDGSKVALALGPIPSTRVALLDGQSGAIDWVFKDEDTAFGDLPEIRFETDGAHVLAGFMSRGAEGSSPFPTASQPSGSRFIRFRSSDGQKSWDQSFQEANDPIVGTASGPQITLQSNGIHQRSYTLTLPGGQHFQRIERVFNSTGQVIAGFASIGEGGGALHLQELGQDATGANLAIAQLQDPQSALSANSPTLGLLSWRYSSIGVDVEPFDAEAVEGVRPLGSAFAPESRIAALVSEGAVSNDLILTVTELDSGQVLAQAAFDKPYPGASAMVRLSEDGQYAAVRSRSFLFLGAPSDRLWVIDLQTGNVAWERELPRGTEALPGFIGSPEAGYSSLELAEGRVLVTDAIPSSDPVQHRLHCLELATGAELWNRDLGCHGSIEAHIAVDAPSVYAAGELDLGPTTAPTILDLDLQDGSVRSQIPLPAEQCILALSVQSDSVGVLTEGPEALFDNLSRCWAFDRETLALLDTQEGVYFGLVPLSGPLGFAVIGLEDIQQVGLRDFVSPGQSPWTIEAPFALPGEWVSVENGDLLVRWEGQVGQDLRLTAWDAFSGAELWQVEDFLPDSSGIALAASPANELHVWNQVEASVASSQGQIFATEVRSLRFPDVYIAPGQLSLSTGGQAELELRGELSNKSTFSNIYFVLGGSAPVANGPLIGQFTLPFDPLDPFFAATLASQTGTFDDFDGNLNIAGNATARVTIPAGLDPALAGEDFYFSFAQFELTEVAPGVSDFEITGIGSPAPLMLVP